MMRPSDVGRRAVEQGLVTSDQLQEALAARAPDVGAWLAAKGYLSWDALRSLKRSPEPAAERRFGKFTLLRELGRGGMGVVWEARDNELGRNVALKLLRGYRDGAPNSDGPLEEESFLRFTREALTAAKLQHPNIVKIFEVSAQDGVHFIAMEYVNGRTLGEAAAAPDRSLPALVTALRDAARAVHYAHEQGILHRDVKPENILLSAAGHAYVTDFGLARDLRAEERLTITGVALGTPSYMPPEHVQDSKGDHDRRADVYSLGAVLYELLAGRPPFAGETATQVLLKVLHEDLVAPRDVRADVPVELETICLRAMHREKESRYASAAALADDLDRYLQGEPVQARRPSVTYRLKKRILKHRGAAVATAAALLLLAGWMTTLFVQSRGAAVKAPDPLKSAAPPVPKPPPLAPLSFEAGRPSREAGLSVRTPDGEKCDVEAFEGVAAVRPLRADGQASFLLLDVEDAWASRVPMAEVEIHYYDAGPAWSNFSVEYDSTDERWPQGGAYKRAGLIVLEGGRKWRTARFILSSPRLQNRMDLGADLRLGPDRADILVHRVELRPWTSAPAFAGPPSAVDGSRLRPGLAAEYHAGVQLADPRGRAIDEDLAFDWQEGSWEGGPPDRFSIRWEGGFLAPRRGRYLVEVQSDDGSKVFVGGREVISNWKPHAPMTDVALCDLDAGYYPLKVEYFEEGGHAYFRVTWFEERNGRMTPLAPPPLVHVPQR